METTDSINQPRMYNVKYDPSLHIDYSQRGNMSRRQYKYYLKSKERRRIQEEKRIERERIFEEARMKRWRIEFEKNRPALEKLYGKFCDKTYNALCAKAKPGIWRVLSIILYILLVYVAPLAILIGILYFIIKIALGLLVFCIFALAFPFWLVQALSGK